MNIVAEAISMDEIVEFSIEDDFADNRVIVIFDNDTSLNCDELLPEDYMEIGCKDIKALSSYTDMQVKSTMDNIARHVLEGEDLQPYNGIELGKYNKVVSMKLEENDKENVIEVIKKLQKYDNVLYAIPDYKLSVCSDNENTDEYAQCQSGMYEMIGLDKVWNFDFSQYPSETISIGIVDSGIDVNHPDLNYSDKSCVVNIDLSYDFTGGKSATQDTHGHGTMCAGIIGAVRNNSIGISGVCGDQGLNIELVSLKVHTDGDGYSEDVCEAIDYARVEGIDILNISLGWCLGTQSESYYTTYYNDAFDEITEDFPGLIVCAAGNMGEDADEANDNDDIHHYPSCWDKNYVISVGSCEASTKAYYSNYGKECVDIFAPGTGIYSTFPTDMCTNGTHQLSNCTHEYPGYHSGFGTSFAAPYVAGMAALMLRVNSTLSPEDIISKFINSADPSNTLKNKCFSGGTLNAFNSLMMAVDHTNHNYEFTNKSPSLHNYTCRDCNYSFDEAHNYGIVSGTDIFTVKCDNCNRTVECTHTKTYTQGASSHIISCSTCNFSVSENHIKTYQKTSSVPTRHTVTCSACGYSYTEHHVWTSMADTTYQCVKCKLISIEDPETMRIEDEEETVEIISALPPSDEDEDLTE